MSYEEMLHTAWLAICDSVNIDISDEAVSSSLYKHHQLTHSQYDFNLKGKLNLMTQVNGFTY